MEWIHLFPKSGASTPPNRKPLSPVYLEMYRFIRVGFSTSSTPRFSQHPSPSPATNHPKLAQPFFPRKLPGAPEVEWEGQRRFHQSKQSASWLGKSFNFDMYLTHNHYGRCIPSSCCRAVSFAHLSLDLKTNDILKGMYTFTLELKKGYDCIWLVNCSSFHNFHAKKNEPTVFQ